MTGKRRRFAARPLATLLTLLFTAAFVALGLWQLDRAGQKRRLADRYSERHNSPALRLDAKRAPADELIYYPVVAEGRYEPRYQFMLANRVHNGRLGYDVLTPLLIDGGGTAVLVDRGWVAHDYNTNRAPAVDTPAGTVRVQGTVTVPHRNIFAMEPPAGSGEWQRVWYTLDLERYAARVPFAVQPFVVQLAPDATGGFVREWYAPLLNPARNRSYALQWFAMAVTVVVVYVVTSMRRARKRSV